MGIHNYSFQGAVWITYKTKCLSSYSKKLRDSVRKKTNSKEKIEGRREVEVHYKGHFTGKLSLSFRPLLTGAPSKAVGGTLSICSYSHRIFQNFQKPDILTAIG